MGKGSPKPPDPERVARAEAQANRINQITPFGSLRFFAPGQFPAGGVAGAGGGGGGRSDFATAVTTLSPEQQQILDLQQEAALTLGGRALEQAGGLAAGSPFSLDLPEISRTAPELLQLQQDTERAAFERAMSLLNPQIEQRERALRDRLANQGLPQAGEAFTSELERFEQGVNEAERQAAFEAVLAGEQARSQAFRDLLAGRQTGLQEAVTARQLPLNEMLTLLGLGQVQQPQFFGPGQVDVLGANQLAQQAGQFRSGLRQKTLGGLLELGGSLGGAAILASSRDLKNVVSGGVPGLDAITGLDVERWTYKGEDAEHVGPMAEQWHEKTGLGDGATIHAVDALGVAMKAIQDLSARIDELESADG